MCVAAETERWTGHELFSRHSVVHRMEKRRSRRMRKSVPRTLLQWQFGKYYRFKRTTMSEGKGKH